MNYVSFFTATILYWKPLLANDKYKDTVIDSMKYLVKGDRVFIYAFVIMPNHLHIVWQIKKDLLPSDVQRDFLKFTAQKIKYDLRDNNPVMLKEYYSGAKDREYQFWERNPLTSRLPSTKLIEQKINYIHANPIRGKWDLASDFTKYKYSSARFYYEGIDEWGFLTQYTEAVVE